VRKVSDKQVDRIKTHILYQVNYFYSGNPAVYEIITKNMAKPKRPHKM